MNYRNLIAAGLSPLLAAILFLITATPVVAQEDDSYIRPALDVALQGLRDHLNQAIPYVQRYTWEETMFEEGITGCAANIDSQMIFFGWRFVFTLYEGKSYEVRESFDQQIIVICDQVTAEIATTSNTTTPITTPGAIPASIDLAVLNQRDANGRSIVIDLSEQRIYAFEHGQLIRNELVSTGQAGMETPLGDFQIYRFRATRDMPGYDGVPWVMYFYPDFAIHGADWHNDFGKPVSHGCVNLPVASAKWFYDFAVIGTPVHIQA